MMFKGGRALASLTLCALLPSLSPGQMEHGPPPPAPQFQVRGTTVRIDVVVTDKDNRVLRGLGIDDFLLYEDDIPQDIDTIQLVGPEGTPASPHETVAPADRQASVAPSPYDSDPAIRRPNLIIMLLDYATTDFESQHLVEQASVKYVRESLRPGDYIAIFALGSAFRCLQDFTNNRDALIAALDRRDISGRAAAAGGVEGPSLSGAGEEALAAMGTTTPAGGSPQERGAAMQAEGSDNAQLMFADRIQGAFRRMGSFLAERETRSVLRAVAAIAQGVGGIEGRKTLILFSQGFVVGGRMERDFEKTIGIANRANVAIYGIDSQGLMPRATSGELVPSGQLSSISAATGPRRKQPSGGESLFDRAREVGSDQRDTALRHISVATGGFAIRNTNDLHIGMQRIDEDIRSYYLIGYRPKNQQWDGGFRSIRLEARRPGATVRARSGYRAVPPGMEMVTQEEFQLLRAVESLRIAATLPTFLRLDTFPARSSDQTVLVTLDIPSSALQFEQVEQNGSTERQCRLEIIGLIRNEQGDVVDKFGSPVTLHLTPGEYEVLSRGSVSFSNQLALPPGAYRFEALVRDGIAGKVGRAQNSLRVPSPTAELALSTIVLGKSVEKGRGDSGVPLEDGTRLLPVAQRIFRDGDPLVFYFQIHNFVIPSSKTPELSVSVALERPGSHERMTLPEHLIRTPTDSPVASFSRYLELKGLPAGLYLLTAKVTDRLSGRTAETRTAFTKE